jgi:Toxin PAAR-like domain
MGTSVVANGRSIIHKGHGQTHVAAPPDVCKTPSPGGPIPVPYPNLAMDSNLADGAASVQIEGNPVGHVKSKISTSSGDEPGTVGGIMSNVNKGTCTWKMGSPNVKAEGESVVRFVDTTFHNGNSFNSTWIDNGGPALGYADDFAGLCPLCGEPPLQHGIPSRPATARACAAIIRDLQARARAVQGGAPVGHGEGISNKYMVGVMQCKCTSDNLWATMSNQTIAGFTNIAGPHVGGNGHVIQGGPAEIGDFVNANTSAAVAPAAAFRAMLAATMYVTVQIMRARPRTDHGFTEVGTCAGAKLLARSSHAPVAMTEMFFEFVKKPGQRLWQQTYNWRVQGNPVPGGRTFNAADNNDPHHPGIGSCNTCQRTLYLTMCPTRVCTG